MDPRGALIVADDLSNTVWRVAPSTAPASDATPAQPPAPAPAPPR